MPQRSTSRQTEKEKTKETILDSARALFLQGDFASVTTDAIARQAGVSKGTIFYHFPTKESLAIEVINNSFHQFQQIVSKKEKHLTPTEAARDIIRDSLDFALENIGLTRLLIQVMGRVGEEKTEHLFQQVCEPFLHEFEKLFTKFNVKNPSSKALLLAAMLDGLGIYFYAEAKEKNDKLLQDLTDEIFTLFLGNEGNLQMD